MKESSKISFTVILSAVGAFAAYAIGSGFATGQECLQYFASWGPKGYLVALLCSCLLLGVTFPSMVRVGFNHLDDFEKESDSYQFYAGKALGTVIDYFSVVLVFLVLIAVYAGCGATIKQYFHLPEYIGTILIGIASAAVVMLGLKRMVQVLGFLGIVFIIYIVSFGIYSYVTNDAGITQTAARLPEYIEEGKVLQAGIFGIYNPVWSGLNYAGVVLVTSFPFIVALGQRAHSGMESALSGLSAGVVFHLPALCSCIAMLSHMDYIAAYGQQVPMLASITEALPAISWSYTLILLLGIFTTVTGYTWFLTERFTEEGTKANRILCVAVTLVCMVAGSILPLT